MNTERSLWPTWILVGFLLMLVPVASSLLAQSDADFDHGFIAYSKTETTEPVRGTSTFAADFEKTGVRDSKGRSLKDLDLKTRFLRYPLSYLIYSQAFDELPGPAKEIFYERAWTILSGGDAANYPNLTIDDRTAIREILQDTKPDFARAPHK